MRAKPLGTSKQLNQTRLILGGVATVTLYFQSNLADPFNSPKFWILMAIAAWSIGSILSYKELFKTSQDLRLCIYLVLVFIFSALFATIFTDSKYVAIFGDTQRHNGFLSYLSLAILLIATSLQINWSNIKKFFITTYFIATISAIYAILQTTGNDFVKWVNPYNSIIGTLGNPNFASAVMAIMAVLIFSSLFCNNFTKYQKYFAFILVIFLLGLILRSNARQGLLSFVLGAIVFLLIWLYSKRKVLGRISLGSSFILFIFASLGMLQIGPLEKFLYKPSVSVRGYYWRAGIEMFMDKPIVGVGMDRYGYYFNQYREVAYPLNYGFEITSSNAHNTFIQLFATGGFFLGMSYLVLLTYIAINAIKNIRSLTGDEKYLFSGLFAAWVAFQAQSFISIDNVGVSIWGWVLSGIILGLSRSTSEQSKESKQIVLRKSKSIDLKKLVISTSVTSIVLIMVIFLYRGENNSYKASGSYNSENQVSVDLYRNAQMVVIKSILIDPNYSLRAATNLILSGSIDEGIASMEALHKKDTQSLAVLNALAYVYEVQNEISQAILYREKIVKLNPWDANNYLALGKNYKNQGNLEQSTQIFQKIISYAVGVNGGPIAEQAKIELAP